MKPVLIQYQTPSIVIYGGVKYSSMNEFATKHKFYNNDKKKLLIKYIWSNFKYLRDNQNNIYNIDLADDYDKSKFELYLKGKSFTRKYISTQIVYKNKLYVSITNLADELNICRTELRRILVNNYKNVKEKVKIVLSKKVEKEIENKIIRQKNKIRIDSFKVIYNDLVFKSIAELARFINIKDDTLRLYIKYNNFQPENYTFDLNNEKLKKLRLYLEKKDIEQKLISFEDKVKDFANSRDIPLYKITSLIKDKSIKNIEELKRYYQYIY